MELINNPIRILQVFSRMDRGGSETAMMNFYRAIDKSKVQFDFLVHTLDKCDYDEEIETLGGRIFKMPRYNFANHFTYKAKWKRFLKDHPEYQVIHGHYFTISAVYFSVAKRLNRKCIAHIHSAYKGKGIEYVLMNLLTFPVRYLADYYFACSYESGEWLYGKRIFKNARFKILTNSIDVAQYAFNEKVRSVQREKLGIGDNFVIGHVGRFHQVKNHQFIIDIFKAIHDINENVILMLVGDGSLRSEIETKCATLGLYDKVIFTGVRTDIPEMLQAMDIFVLPSLYEGIPVTLIEAQASGLHCLVSDTITKEVKITDLVEFISLTKSPNVWAGKVLNIINGYKRIDTSKEIEKAGYNVNKNTQWLTQFYLDLN